MNRVLLRMCNKDIYIIRRVAYEYGDEIWSGPIHSRAFVQNKTGIIRNPYGETEEYSTLVIIPGGKEVPTREDRINIPGYENLTIKSVISYDNVRGTGIHHTEVFI